MRILPVGARRGGTNHDRHDGGPARDPVGGRHFIARYRPAAPAPARPERAPAKSPPALNTHKSPTAPPPPPLHPCDRAQRRTPALAATLYLPPLTRRTGLATASKSL